MRFHKRLFDYEPSEKVSVLLADLSDHGNAGATSIPRDAVRIQIAPLSYIFETVTANERMNMIMNHELTHVATMDRPAASDRFFRTVFAGKVMPVDEQPETILYFYLTSPRLATPRWYLEGIAVFLDTWMGGGIGRAQGAWDEMVFRSMVRDGSRFYDPLGLVSEGVKVDFQTETNSYLYGTRFMTWLAYEYSPEKLIQWVSRREGSRAYYASNFERVFGTSLEKAWARWVEWEHGFQEKNLARIREFPRTPYKDISDRALGSVSRPAVDPAVGKLYAAFYYPGIVAHVGSIDLEDGSVEKIKDVKGPVKHSVTSLAYDPETRTIFYTTDNDAYRDLVALDPATGKTRMLLKDARIGDLAWSASDRSLWGIRTFNGICTLVQIPSPWTAWKKVYSWPYGQVAYDLDVSPDGSLISISVGEVTGHQSVKIIPVEGLSRGDPTPRAEFDFGTAVPSSFVFSPDGRYLYGTSYYTGVSNIFRYEIATHDLQAVTNSETGFFRPVPLGGDDLMLSLHGRGVRAHAHPGDPRRRRKPDRLPGSTPGGEASGGEELEAAPPFERQLRREERQTEALPHHAGDGARVALSGRPGVQGLAGGRPARQLLRSSAAQPGRHRRLLLPGRGPARRREGTPRRRVPPLRLASLRLAQQR